MRLTLPSDDLSSAIYDLLYCLGLTADHVYFFHTACAVRLAVEDPQRLSLVTKWLYPEVGKHYGATSAAVEKNIRTAVLRVWTRNPGLLSSLSNVPLTSRPTNARFLAILAIHFSGFGSSPAI